MEKNPENDPEKNPEENPRNNASLDKQPGIMTLVKALAFISVIVLLEVAGASMIVPSARETAEIADKMAAAEATREIKNKTAAEDSEAGPLPTLDVREVLLGSFHVLTYDSDTGSSMNVDFELYGTVLADEESEFFQLFEINERRIREQILITVRGTGVTDLTDAGLGLIKRKILEKTNRALGKPLLHEVIFSEFAFTER